MAINRKSPARVAAFGGVASAAAIAILYIASVLPTLELALGAVAGMAVALTLDELGVPTSAAVWLVSGALALLVCPVKDAAVEYALFFGLYPIIKYFAEKIRNRAAEYAVKFGFFNAILALYFFAASKLFELPEEITSFIDNGWLWLGWIVLNGVFLLYDIAFSRVMTQYARVRSRRGR